MLSSVSSAEAGRWRTDRVPYMREILDKLSPSNPCQRVVFVKSVQVGATESGLNFIGAFMDMEPCPMLYIMPTLDMAKGLSKKRLSTMIQECETLRNKVAPMNRRDGSSSLLEKFFAGGALNLIGANSASSLSSNPIRVVMMDEVDRYPLSADNEGSPIKLAEARTTTYSRNKKIFLASTPTNSNSVIYREFLSTDQRYYNVPCPHCGTYQPLKFSNLKWPNGKPHLAAYECAHCSELIQEHHKTKMLLAGEWMPTVAENVTPEIAGYAINALYSPLGWMSWAKIATKFLAEKDDTIEFRTFVNTVLGEPWEEKGEAPEWENIFNKRERYPMNQPSDDVCLITVGCDVQKDRVELEIVGWCRDKSTYSIDYRVLQGDTSEKDVWDKLAEVVNETWLRPDGVELPMMLMAVDSGYNTQHVYDFCRRFDASRVIPIKGSDTQRTTVSAPRSVDINMHGKATGTIKLWSVGSSVVKSEVYANLRLHPNEDGTYPPNYCHFPEYAPEFFKGITAEQIVVSQSHGYLKYQWEKKYARNEPLDCRVYARAAATVAGMDRFNEGHWDALIGKYRRTVRGKDEPQYQKQPQKAKKPSSFWGDR
jgi:phage terminase large subunit GpA-like protein